MQNSLMFPKSLEEGGIRSSCMKLKDTLPSSSEGYRFHIRILNITRHEAREEAPINIHLVVGGSDDTYALGRDPKC